VAFNAGFENIYNIEQGFEGDLDENDHRGSFNGWRFHNLPWRQE
jgi:rhodanese-related sulfurtransferase